MCQCLTLFMFTAAHAASLELRSSKTSLAANESTTVELVLNVGTGEKVWGYEAGISFPDNLLTYDTAGFVAGTIFQNGGKTVQSASGGIVTVGGYYDATETGTTTGGVVATMKFTGKTAGTANVVINCDQFTNVYSSGAVQNNLFTNCAAAAPKVVLTIGGGGGGGGSSPTATPVPTATALTQLPATGTFENMTRVMFLGGGLLALGILLMLGFSRMGIGFSRITKK